MVQSDNLRLAGGDADVGGSQLRLWYRDAALDIEFDHTEGLLVSLNCRADSHQEALGSVSVHDDPLARLDPLEPGREGLRIQPKVENHFLGGGGYPAEVGVCWLSPSVIHDHLGGLLALRILLRVHVSGLFLFTHVRLRSRLLLRLVGKGLFGAHASNHLYQLLSLQVKTLLRRIPDL